jgi:urea transport system ATP-binding protein
LVDDVPALVEIRDLKRYFGGIRAIDGISLRLAAGELRCIIGPNGAGKSTLFQLLAGHLRPSAGRIFFDGRDITRTEPFQRARMGIAVKVQSLGVFSNLTIGHNLAVARHRHGDDGELPRTVAMLMDRLGLLAMANTLVRTLSHGQKQWLALGMSLLQRPRLLLLDEPTAGMSPEETSLTAQIVRAANADGATIMVIEHDMAFVRQLQAPVSVLHLGRLFAHGQFDEIEANDEVRHLYLGERRNRTR